MEAKSKLTRAERQAMSREKNRSFFFDVVYRLNKNKVAMVSLYVLVAVVLLCLFVPIFSSFNLVTTAADAKYLPPSAKHWLGTDMIGRDLFTRLFYGGRISLGVALTVTLLESALGVLVGCLAGFYGGVIDAVFMRLAEVFLSLPFLLTAITIAAVFGHSIPTLILVLVILSWPGIARIIRGQILTLREMEYMQACEALGISDAKRIVRHLLPNLLAFVIVYGTLEMASVIMTETALSFLGLGVSPPIPTWGNLIQEARGNLQLMFTRWWTWIPPGFAIFISVMAFNLLGDGLRDAIDPKMKR